MLSQVIRLVVTDLDGTFWGSDMTVPTAHLRAVEELVHRGVEVMVATSRRRRVAAEHLRRAGLLLPAVLLDGAMGIDLRDGRRFHDAAFSIDDAVLVLGLFRRHSLEPCIYVHELDVDVVLPARPSTSAAHVDYLRPIARTGDLDVTVATPGVYGFSVTGRDRAELEPLARALRGHGSELMLLSEAKYGGWSLVVAPPGVTKWTGVMAYCALCGIDPAEVLAVGDGDNDVDMLDRAGVSVGVRGGTDRAIRSADHLIEGPGAGGWAALVDIVDGAAN